MSKQYRRAMSAAVLAVLVFAGEASAAELAGNLVVTGRVGIAVAEPTESLDVLGNIKASGTITGSGSGLTSLNAGNLDSGTIPTARLSGIYDITATNAQNAAALGHVAAANYARTDIEETFETNLFVNGNVGVGVADPGYALDVLGDVNLSGNLRFNGTAFAPVTSVAATSPLASSGGATPTLSIQTASGSQAGALASADWTTRAAGSGL